MYEDIVISIEDAELDHLLIKTKKTKNSPNVGSIKNKSSDNTKKKTIKKNSELICDLYDKIYACLLGSSMFCIMCYINW